MKIINDIIATRLLFFIMAFFVGLWTIRIPTIKDQINTDYFGIGLVMATFAIGSIIAMVFANNVIKMSSARTVLFYTSILQAILWLPTPFISSLQMFMIFSFIFGLCYGSFEISCNLYASNLEKREKKSMMSGFHAFWSLGVLTGSIATSLFLEWNISFLNNVIKHFNTQGKDLGDPNLKQGQRFDFMQNQIISQNIHNLPLMEQTTGNGLGSIIEPLTGKHNGKESKLKALEESELKKIPQVCGSLREAMENLDKDRAFLTQGGVFTDDQIDGYISLKFEEIYKLEHTPHPIEFEMYYSQ